MRATPDTSAAGRAAQRMIDAKSNRGRTQDEAEEPRVC